MALAPLSLEAKLIDVVGSIDSSIDIASHMTYAFREIIDILSVELLVKYCAVDADIGARVSVLGSGNVFIVRTSVDAVTSVKDYRILMVTYKGRSARLDTLDNKIDFEENSGSIYEATDLSPVYYVYDEGDQVLLTTEPEPETDDPAKIYAAEYIEFVDEETEGVTVGLDSTSIANFPVQAEYAFLLSTALRILNAKLALSVGDDEDLEIVQLLQSQIGNINGLYQAEMATLNKENKPA